LNYTDKWCCGCHSMGCCWASCGLASAQLLLAQGWNYPTTFHGWKQYSCVSLHGSAIINTPTTSSGNCLQSFSHEGTSTQRQHSNNVRSQSREELVWMCQDGSHSTGSTAARYEPVTIYSFTGGSVILHESGITATVAVDSR